MTGAALAVKTESSVGCVFDDDESYLLLGFSSEVALRLDDSSCFQSAMLSVRGFLIVVVYF